MKKEKTPEQDYINSRRFTINVKKFASKYFNSIEQGIKKRYSELYPDKKIEIHYIKRDNAYRFFVNIYIDLISDDNVILNDKTLVKTYDNITAIKLFSNITMEEYIEEYDDSKKNYMQEFKDEVDSIIIYYKLANIKAEISEVKIDSTKYVISFEGETLWSNRSLIGYFNYDILTKEEKIKSLRAIRTGFAKKYENKKY
jgi:hypothetical protein